MYCRCSKQRCKTGRGKRSKSRIGQRRKSHQKKIMSADKEILESLSRSTDWMSSLEIPSNWTNMSVDINQLRLCLVSFQEVGRCPPLVVTPSLVVNQDSSWLLHVHGHLVGSIIDPLHCSNSSIIRRQ